MSDNLPNEVNNTVGEEIATNVNESNLLKIFGSDAKIEKEGENYKVDVILKDGFCKGGQRVQVDIKPQNDIYDTLIVNNLIVNGASLTEIFGNKFFFRTTQEDKDNKANKSGIMPHLLKFQGTKAYDGGHIKFVSLEDADGLAALFHEIGHTRDRRSSSINEIDIWAVGSYLIDKQKAYSEDQISDIKQSGVNILDFEMFANKMAIKCILFLSKKGFEMFKNDEDLNRVKKFLTTTTIARFNGSQGFVDLVTIQKINEVLTF